MPPLAPSRSPSPAELMDLDTTPLPSNPLAGIVFLVGTDEYNIPDSPWVRRVMKRFSPAARTVMLNDYWFFIRSMPSTALRHILSWLDPAEFAPTGTSEQIIATLLAPGVLEAFHCHSVRRAKYPDTPEARLFLSGVWQMARFADPANRHLNDFLKVLSWNGGILPGVATGALKGWSVPELYTDRCNEEAGYVANVNFYNVLTQLKQQETRAEAKPPRQVSPTASESWEHSQALAHSYIDDEAIEVDSNDSEEDAPPDDDDMGAPNEPSRPLPAFRSLVDTGVPIPEATEDLARARRSPAEPSPSVSEDQHVPKKRNLGKGRAIDTAPASRPSTPVPVDPPTSKKRKSNKAKEAGAAASNYEPDRFQTYGRKEDELAKGVATLEGTTFEIPDHAGPSLTQAYNRLRHVASNPSWRRGRCVQCIAIVKSCPTRAHGISCETCAISKRASCSHCRPLRENDEIHESLLKVIDSGPSAWMRHLDRTNYVFELRSMLQVILRDHSEVAHNDAIVLHPHWPGIGQTVAQLAGRLQVDVDSVITREDQLAEFPDDPSLLTFDDEPDDFQGGFASLLNILDPAPAVIPRAPTPPPIAESSRMAAARAEDFMIPIVSQAYGTIYEILDSDDEEAPAPHISGAPIPGTSSVLSADPDLQHTNDALLQSAVRLSNIENSEKARAADKAPGTSLKRKRKPKEQRAGSPS
ncbi:hypothetical protein C8R44DRAFT_891899 [Mycena epipterygia]|nr:hypothetical protein C8R44DRAFT_891899 [Mycena epipterygia]